MAAAADSKGGAAEPAWQIGLLFRHATQTDPSAITKVAQATGDSRTHVEIVARFPCDKSSLCRWCKTDPDQTEHFVSYTVRAGSGVLRVSPAKLGSGGQWVLYTANCTPDQVKRILRYCDDHVGDPYRSLAAVACAQMCLPICACCSCCYPTNADMAALVENEDTGPSQSFHCSLFVMAALEDRKSVV